VCVQSLYSLWLNWLGVAGGFLTSQLTVPHTCPTHHQHIDEHANSQFSLSSALSYFRFHYGRDSLFQWSFTCRNQLSWD